MSVPDATGPTPDQRATAGLAPLRALPIPDRDPAPTLLGTAPEPHTPDPPQQEMLALSFTAAGRAIEDPDQDPLFAPQRTARDHLPDPGAVATHVVHAAVEVLRGARPVTQLMRWLSPEVYEQLARRCEDRRTIRPARTMPPHVQRARISEPADGVAEVSLVVRDGARVRAVAVRLEGVDRRWRATALEMR